MAAASFFLGAVLCLEFLLSPCTPLHGFMKQVKVVAVPDILLLPATLYQSIFFQYFTIRFDQLSAFQQRKGYLKGVGLKQLV